MEQDTNPKQDKKEETIPEKPTGWVEKTEDFLDDTAEKIHQSEAYRKAGKSMERVTKKMFRQAGKWWGKSEQYFKK